MLELGIDVGTGLLLGAVIGVIISIIWGKRHRRIIRQRDGVYEVSECRKDFDARQEKEAAYRQDWNTFCDASPNTGLVSRGPGLREVHDETATPPVA